MKLNYYLLKIGNSHDKVEFIGEFNGFYEVENFLKTERNLALDKSNPLEMRSLFFDEKGTGFRLMSSNQLAKALAQLFVQSSVTLPNFHENAIHLLKTAASYIDDELAKRVTG